MAGLDEAYNRLVDAHVAYVIKMNTELTDLRHVQYIDKVEDIIDEIKNVAHLIIGERDEDGAPVEKVDKEKLKEDYALAKMRLEARIAELKVTVSGIMDGNQHREHLKTASELNNYLLTDFWVLGSNLRATLPEEAAIMQTEHEAVFKEKIPIIEKALADLRQKTPRATGGHDQQPHRGQQGGVGGFEVEHPPAGAHFQTPRK